MIDCPDGYTARAYVGPTDHPSMAAVLSAFNLSNGGELVTSEQMDVTYSHIAASELERDECAAGSKPTG